MIEKRPALGKGLSALIPDAPERRLGAMEVDVDRLTPNRVQPRGNVDETSLDELTNSIRSNGIIQPIVVRQNGDRYEIIAGERRWRAAQRAGLQRVPIVVREIAPGADRSLLEMALVENIQRENLNPIDEALAYRRLSDEFQLTQEEIAGAVGKDRATIANCLRLLRLPDEARREVAAGNLSMGHARALLALPSAADQLRTARDVLARGLSVRETEALVRKTVEGQNPAAAPAPKPVDVHTRAAEDRLRLALGTRVRIVRKGQRGRIEIEFTSEDELIRIFDQLTERS
jgi:ParB family chromosome partitioning protein